MIETFERKIKDYAKMLMVDRSFRGVDRIPHGVDVTLRYSIEKNM